MGLPRWLGISENSMLLHELVEEVRVSQEEARLEREW